MGCTHIVFTGLFGLEAAGKGTRDYTDCKHFTRRRGCCSVR